MNGSIEIILDGTAETARVALRWNRFFDWLDAVVFFRLQLITYTRARAE